MSEREKILRYYKADGEGDLAAHLLDIVENVVKSKKYKVSSFLDQYGFTIAETVAAHYKDTALLSSGGYDGAERLKAAFVHKDFLELSQSINFSMCVLSATWDWRYYQLSHRDVLGALIGQGIKRELLGDIVVSQGTCQIILDEQIKEYMISNLTSIGKAPVTVEEISLEEILPKEEKVKEVRATVASLRLDSVAAAGFGTSRSKMADAIAVSRLKVNFKETVNASQSVKAGDIISMRGRGRLEICEIPGQTKKGRYSVILKRYY